MVTVRGEPDPSARGALRVRLTCTPGGTTAIDEAWDLDGLPGAADPGAVAGRRVARLVGQMRRLGCRCPLDFSGLTVVRDALSRVGR